MKLLFGLLISFNVLFSVGITPLTLDFSKNVVSFSLSNKKSEPIGVYFVIKKITKDEKGNIREEEIKNLPFKFNQPLLILDAGETQEVKLKYIKKLPEMEQVYSLEIKEKLLTIDKNSLTFLHNLKTKIFVGGEVKKPLICKVEDYHLQIINSNSKHQYLQDKKIIVNNKDITSSLQDKKLLGYYLPSNLISKRKIDTLKGSCEIK